MVVIYIYNLTNKEISLALREFSDLLEIKGENKFKVRAYYNASRRIGNINDSLKEMVEKNQLKEIQGIGSGIAAVIKELFEYGYCQELEELRTELPSGILELIKIPGLGPKRAHQLYYELEIHTIEDLNKALKDHQVQSVKGFGEKTEEKLITALKNYQRYQGVILLHQALTESERIMSYLRKSEDIIRMECVGSIRRGKDLIGDINILVSSSNTQALMDYLLALPVVKEVINSGVNRNSLITDSNIQIDIRVVNNEEFPTALHYFTGSKEHNLRIRKLANEHGYKLYEYGIFKDDERLEVADEVDIYQMLGLDYIIPELREDRGEIEAALSGKLPASITLSDIRGELHCHSRYSDGAYSIEEMVQAARKRGYNYIAITDHSRSLRVAHGMSPETLKKQLKEIDKLQEKFTDIRIIKGIEVDILNDGSLDYSDQLLSQLDLVIASIHTGFNQSEEQITSRIISAMENRYVNIIAHPRGRILKRRGSYQVNLEKVIKSAAKTGTALEINASPYRLDLDDLSVKFAKEYGVKIAINTDAHHNKELEDMKLGVTVARRGWLEKEDVLNTMDTERLLSFLRED